jgi:hypothetical protein
VLISTISGLSVLRPLPVLGFQLEGCSLRVTAVDAAGQPIGTAIGGSHDASQQAPLRVPPDGSLEWVATEGDGTLAPSGGMGDWHVEAFGMPTPLRGTAASAASAGTLRVDELLPFRLAGLFHLTGEWRANGRICRGGGWLQLTGDPFSSLPFSVALALLLLGVVLVSVGLRGSPGAGMAGGPLLGGGAAMAMVIYGQLPFGVQSPLVVLLLGLLLGTLAVLTASWPARRSAARPARRMGAGERS